MRRIIIGILVILAVSIFAVSWYLRGVPPIIPQLAILSPSILSESVSPVAYKVEQFVTDLTVPWSLVFTSPDRLLVAERTGSIRVINKGVLRPTPLFSFSDVISRSEGGLLGMALHPQYQKNKYIYASYDYMTAGETWLKIVRLIDEGNTARFDRTIVDNIPGESLHTGSRIKFGPDGFLYITTGDIRDRKLAQDKNSLAGKILRISDDGRIPDANPIPGSAIYSYGHRNPQGLTWQPGTNRLFSTEHGPSGFDGPGGGDELNIILPGKSYGWPTVSHDRSASGHVSPIQVWTPAVAPASAEFYTGTVFPQFYGNLFFGGLVGEGLFRVVLDSSGQKVADWEKLSEISFGRIRDVVTGPEGFIYFSTSNQDGRGKARPGDDKIYRLVPTSQ